MAFSNGPLPVEFRPAAYLTSDEGEWALPKSEALAYLRWASEQELEILGFDIWAPTLPGPSVCSGDGGFDGDARECAAEIQTKDFAYIQQTFGVEPVFNIWVGKDRGEVRREGLEPPTA